MKIVLYSVGLLGASIGCALKKSGFNGEIFGISSLKNIQDAISVNAIDYGVGYEKTQEVLLDCDLLFLCSPIKIIIETIKNISKMNLKAGMLITDIGSTKKEIFETAVKYLPENVKFIAGHPMAGSEKSGSKFADPFLFQNAIWVLYSKNMQDAQNLGSFLGQYMGCKTQFIAPETHDKIAAVISHVPHIIAVGLVNAAEKINRKIKGTFDLAAGGIKSMTRIASSPYYMWHDIYKTNREANIEFLDLFIEEIRQLRNALSDENIKLQEHFDSAAKTRTKLSGNSKGFVNNLYQIVVIAEDKPGFLAKMLTVLSNESLNVSDIELLKVREGDAGSFMLAFTEENLAERAIELLKNAGFSARIG
jgi:prephenate dehydrogenase